MFWNRTSDEGIQRLNLAVPDQEVPSTRAAEPAANCITSVQADPAKVAEMERRAVELLKTGWAPRSVFVCQAKVGQVVFRYDQGKRAAMLMFSTPYFAADYIRVTGLAATVGEVKVEALHRVAETWISSGVAGFFLNRSPRCQHPRQSLITTKVLLAQEQAAFHKVWAIDRSTRTYLGGNLVRAACAHLQAHFPADARRLLEEVRDHIDCGVPYLHQILALVYEMLGDQAAKSAAAARLAEFGPQFERQVEFSANLVATASVGLMMTFGLLPVELVAHGR
jgi:hypothetical protein